jgi:hypothetical protein
VLGYVVTLVRADRIHVPFGLVEEPLHTIRRGFPRVFGQLPAVAALDLAQQAGDKPPDPPAGFGTLEVPPDPVDEPPERCGPAHHLAGGLPDHHDAPHSSTVHPKQSSHSKQTAAVEPIVLRIVGSCVVMGSG